MYQVLPFGEKKIRKLIAAGELPVVKVGRDYVTTKERLIEWINKNIGQELYY
jgi:excisionase family DNA binding protein